MARDILTQADQMKQTFGKHYVGGQRSSTLKNVISRHSGSTDASLEDALGDFIRTKGPYLQALDLPRQSKTPWEEFATETADLHEDIIRTFTQAGFRNLFEFQEETIEELRADRHTLVTAGTGRGKTEAWLIPILQFICEAKAGEHPNHPPQSVKCVLTYPTKALAQDQFKRLIEYLFELNKTRSGRDRVTIGIYDGDTPRNEPEALEYLRTSYKFFECPCDDCSSTLTVERTDDAYEVTHQAKTDSEPGLDFIELTREEIVDAEVDILLTNPDTINYRLFNVNEAAEQEVFVSQPKYLVFDEIHEYSELFGAFTAMQMRRYVRSRAALNDTPVEEDDLRLVGSSATVENREAIFQRVNPFVDPDIGVVTENPRTFDAEFPETVERTYREVAAHPEDVRDTFESGRSSNEVVDRLLSIAGITSFDEEGTVDQRVRRVGSYLYDVLVESPESAPELEFVRALYADLRSEPQEPGHLIDRVADEYAVDDDEAEAIVQNFITIGQLSGVLESRAHLFSWPLDGYYTCLNCHTVYDTPRSSCESCGHHFVTKLTYCNDCGEQALESWYCPDCERLESLSVTSSEGQFEYYQSKHCRRCNVDMIRTVWRPYYECSGCGERQKLDHLTTCSECDSVMIQSDDQTQLVCTNPECESTQPANTDAGCHACDSDDLRPLADDETLFCRDCGEVHEASEGQSCSCGGELTPKRFLGWACKDPNCSEVFFGEPPKTCTNCNNRRFVKTGLFDLNAVDECHSCETELFPEHRCDCDDPEITRTVKGFTHFKLLDDQGKVRHPTDFPGAVPCYHPGRSYNKTSRYESMIRGPGNTAVTTSQYLLRGVADPDNPDSFRETKLLSFADSQADMKELARNFDEPEQRLVVTQQVTEVLGELNGDWNTLADVQREVASRIEEYIDMLLDDETESREPIRRKFIGYNSRESFEKYIREEVAARVLRGQFNRYRRFSPELTSNGLVNVRLDVSTLDETKREILKEFHTQSKRYVETISSEIDGAGPHVEELIEAGVLRKVDSESGYLVGLDESAVECALVSDSIPIEYDPQTGDFRTKFEAMVSDSDDSYVQSGAGIDERSQFTHPRFNLSAYQITYSDPLMLLAKPYYGQTEKEERRRTEYQFREGRYPHFLSSGPAMELGVDIGELDSLLLYGTPPNSNSYLQRVGRAGRESGSSLIHAVSQRNPIDYYYYERPDELIQANPQPVPLNETNEEVLRISLTWALLDYLAATWWVTWRPEQSAMGSEIYFEDDLIPRSEPKPNDIVSFSRLLASSNEEVQYGGEDMPLEAIYEGIEDNRDDAEAWLQSLIEFGYCQSCGRKHEPGYEGPCQVGGCEGKVVDAGAQFSHVVDEVLDTYVSELVDLYDVFIRELEDELQEVTDELSKLQLQESGRSRRGRRGRRGREETSGHEDGEDRTERIERRERKERLADRQAQLNQYINDLERMDYGDFLSQQSNAPFSLRSTSDSVTYELIGDDFEPATSGLLSRDIGIALSELHPAAAYLHSDNDIYVVTEVEEDDYESQRLRGDEGIQDEAICPTCGTTHELGEGTCESCGTTLKRLKTIVPKHAMAYKQSLPLDRLSSGEALTPTQVYQDPNSDVQNTFAPVESEVVEFTPDSDTTFAIVNGNGDSVGRFEYGDVRIRSTTDRYRARYKGSGSDPLWNVFEVCGKDNCNGVIARDASNRTSYCLARPEHDTSDSYAVRLATEFETKTVRVQFDDPDLEHAFSHGLRVALQYIGGVGVRAIPESLEDDGAYVYDGEEGGAGITVLLTLEGDEGYPKFQKALELMADSFDCECESGCPFCLYQYGCTNQNDPHTFEKHRLLTLLESDLSLSPISSESDE